MTQTDHFRNLFLMIFLIALALLAFSRPGFGQETLRSQNLLIFGDQVCSGVAYKHFVTKGKNFSRCQKQVRDFFENSQMNGTLPLTVQETAFYKLSLILNVCTSFETSQQDWGKQQTLCFEEADLVINGEKTPAHFEKCGKPLESAYTESARRGRREGRFFTERSREAAACYQREFQNDWELAKRPHSIENSL